MKARTLYRFCAGIIGIDALARIANRLLALQGVAAHIAFMRAARVVYRAGDVESVLLAACAVQIVGGTAAGLHVPPFRYYFAPYYFLAVLALFVHLGCALYWQVQPRSRRARMLAVSLPAAAGSVCALSIVLAMGGILYPVDIPAAYRTTFVLK